MGRKAKYTEKDIKFILENYKKLRAEGVAAKLGYDEHSIRTIYSRERRKRGL